MTGMNASDVKLLIHETVKEYTKQIEECTQDKCPAYHVSVDPIGWKDITGCPQKLESHIQLHKIREKWVKWVFIGMTSLFSSDKLLSLIGKFIQISQHQ
jgi:hypothetical protein